MNEDSKTLKQYCKEAKMRLKSGFWQNARKDLDVTLKQAEKAGVSCSKVKEYYTERIIKNISSHDEETEAFYEKVKAMLEKEGEVPDAIGRLTDREYYKTLSYDQQQRYNLTLSEKYLQAIERYRKEKALQFS